MSALSYERRRACLSKDLTTTPCHPSNRLCKWEGATLCADRALDEGAKRKWEGATLCRGTQRQRTSLRECSAHIVAVAAATPQERAAAAVPALRRGANNERWCCCQLAATAASRLRAPMFQALPAFHVQCSSLTTAGVVWSSLRRAAAGEGAEAMCSSATSAINTLERVMRPQGPTGLSGYQPWAVIPLVSTRMSAAAPGKTKRIVTTATRNGSIAVAGAQVSSTPSVSRVVFLSHTDRCGGRGRGGARSAARRGVRRVSEWAKALGFEVISPAS